MTRKKKIILTIGIVILAGAGYGVMVIRHGFSARDQPSAMEAMTARAARQLAVPSSAKNMVSPVPMTAEVIRKGMEHFADHCAICHANNGNGDTSIGSNMYPKPPDMRIETQKLTDGEIFYTIQNGVRLTGMPAFGEPGSSDDISTWHLVHFIRHLPRLTPAEEAEMKELNPRSTMDMQEKKDEDEFLRGSSPSPTAPSSGTRHKHK